jgi:hypothetical protein
LKEVISLCKIEPLVFSTLKSTEELDVLPPTMSTHYLDNIEETAKWSYFHFIPRYKTFWKAIFEFPREFYTKNLDKIETKKLKSLLSYYYLLPKWARDHPVIKTVVQNIEHTKAHNSYREKQMMVNLAMTLVMPMSEGTEKI